ncbi:HupE/UreJ family protein [Microvirga pudoricolor]|uniref:HupE/UreJ family protein n=1 Tax=Microvirga pudoricolor TaxID=2778729 RepID=UPI00194E5CED|nr:HupE/UreJ family protein [Microvirga pudoricolor]MBM6593296.1 HupE/UreJ family protein [Microvirga pudoricolor]
MKRIVLSAALSFAAAPAFAHTDVGTVSDFAHGFLHPIGGLDHVLAMVTVGLLAALLGGRALWAVPLSFVGMMIVGGALGFMGVEVPAVETGILASIVILGAVVALGRPLPVGLAMALVGVFAIFHGYAHGAEMPMESGAIGYSIGFALATALLHGAGILAGLAAFGHRSLIRFAGGAVAATGLVLALV